jgi:hypothetical protein
MINQGETMRTRIDLGGTWERSIGGKWVDYVPVPGAYAPVGECVLSRTFCAPEPNAEGRHFLHTEGVLAHATFTLNGKMLGQAGPFVPYSFEIPAGLLKRQNTIEARVVDMNEPFGGTPGRRFDGGLTRAIYIERRPSTFIADVAFRYDLSSDLTDAKCRLMVDLDGPAKGTLECSLVETESGRVAAHAERAFDQPIEFNVEYPRLWSPKLPALYRLTVRLRGAEEDEVTDVAGFRKLEVRGRDLFLNNQRLTLKGVCRHEFNEALGYAVPEDEVRRELARIKLAGFNYIRLVHSPHAHCVCRIAAELGILVSEEPGACFHDLADEKIVAPVLQILRRLIRRDRHCPSVLAWFIYNECNPNAEYGARAAEVCRELDPGCLISFADCSGQNENIKAMVAKGQLSFYGINIYSTDPKPYVDRMRVLDDKPVLFTEWGGGWAQNNPHLLSRLCEMFVRHTQPEAEPRAAGCTFWVWGDYEERSRGDMCSPAGYTIEGMVDLNGIPKPDLQVLSNMCFEMDHPPRIAPARVEVLTLGRTRPERWQPVDLLEVAGDQRALEEGIVATRRRDIWGSPTDFRAAVSQFGRLGISGIPFSCRDERQPAMPLLLGPGREEILIPVGRTVRNLAFLGHVAFKGGYPANTVSSVHHGVGEGCAGFGAAASEYEFLFEDGTRLVQPLQHGVHILRANTICRWWKPAPRSPETVPAVQAILHPAFEILRFDLWEHTFPDARRLKSIRWRLKDRGSVQALFALSTAEE